MVDGFLTVDENNKLPAAVQGKLNATYVGYVPGEALDTKLANLGPWAVGDPLRHVVVKPGNYTRSTPVSVPSGVVLTMYGCRYTITDAAYCDVLTNSDWVNGNSHIYVLGGDLDGNVAGNPDNVVAPNGGLSGVTIINAQHVTLRDINTYNTRLHGIDVGVRDYANNSFGDETAYVLIDNCRVTGYGDDGISTHWAHHVTINNCWGHDPAVAVGGGSNSHGLEIDDGSQDIMVNGFVAFNNNGSGIQIQSHSTRTGGGRWQLQNCYSFNNAVAGYNFVNENVNATLRNVTMVNCTSEGNGTRGLWVKNFEDVSVVGFKSINDPQGFDITGSSRNVIISDFQVTDPGNFGIYLPAGEATDGLVFTNGIIARSPSYGIYCARNDVAFENIRVIDCGVDGAQSVAILGSATRVSLTGVTVSGAYGHGFTASGAASKITFTRCRATAPVDPTKDGLQTFGTGGPNQVTIDGCQFDGWAAGIRQAGANAVDMVIRNNDLTGNGAAYVTGGTAKLDGNLGYTTKAQGQATIADAVATVVVTHGLAVSPSQVQLTPRGNQLVWVSARTATTFTISRTGTTGALVVDYRAEV